MLLCVSILLPLRKLPSLTYSWEIAQGENAQQTGLSACAISDDDELPSHNILSLLFRHGRSSGVSLRGVSQNVRRLMEKSPN